MARFFGKVGYGQTVETAPGVNEFVISERSYFGDTLSNSVKSENESRIVDTLTIGNSFSIVADAYAFQNFFAMKYVEWMGVLWTIVDVKVLGPRLTLRCGEVYSGPTPEIPDDSGGSAND